MSSAKLLQGRAAGFRLVVAPAGATPAPLRPPARHATADSVSSLTDGFTARPPLLPQQHRLGARRSVVVRAGKAHDVSLLSITSAMARASGAWTKYDVDRSGQLSLQEAVVLLNSPELQEAFFLITNVEPELLTEEDVRPLYARVDRDGNGTLSRMEFMALLLALTQRRAQRSPVVLAEALLGFFDVDRNGVIEGKELKGLLTILGFPLALILPIPDFIKVEYRSVLQRLYGTHHT